MRFGISETSWMLPKILRMRLDAVDVRVCVAEFGPAMVAMWVCSRLLVVAPAVGPGGFCACPTRKAGRRHRSGALQDAKSRESRIGDRSFARPIKPDRSML